MVAKTLFLSVAVYAEPVCDVSQAGSHLFQIAVVRRYSVGGMRVSWSARHPDSIAKWRQRARAVRNWLHSLRAARSVAVRGGCIP